MEKYEINESTVTTSIEALYWITKIWSENIEKPKELKEDATKKVLDILCDNIYNELR